MVYIPETVGDAWYIRVCGQRELIDALPISTPITHRIFQYRERLCSTSMLRRHKQEIEAAQREGGSTLPSCRSDPDVARLS